jgi:(p)ppGpp synthase/HD superfamily hydrolase
MDKNQQLLGLAIEVATQAHKGQFDKGGKPYILHPLHLMSQLLFDPQLATIAVLHDVIEDSDGVYTLVKLEELGFSERVLAALKLLTHDKNDDYLSVYIAKISKNYDAIRVKKKDLAHNSDITRLVVIREKDLARISKYHQAYLLLEEAKLTFVD